MIDERNAAQEPEKQPRSRAGEGNTLVVLVNAVAAGMGGLYTATRSVVITALAAGLVCLLALFMALTRQEHR